MTPEGRARGERTVWLTFDDGPHPTYTDDILQVLDRFGIKATFFVVGSEVERREEVLKRTYDAGHRIGNHAFTHSDLTKLSDVECRQEIVETEKLISPYAGADRIFRAPYGCRNETVDRIVRESGYRMIGWNIETLDWKATFQPRHWITHGVEQIRRSANSIVLNHDTHKTTAENFDTFLEAIMRLPNVKFGLPGDLPQRKEQISRIHSL
jgi:peptidoglycan/xylan/chitin deacetylase (PgdA/CDA1 family)